MGYLGLKMKVKDSIQFTADVDGYQMKEWLLFSDTGNQANIRFMEFFVNYIILHSW